MDNKTDSAKTRLMSIDALRGFDMFWIIGGDRIAWALIMALNWKWLNSLSPQLVHVEWVGFHFEDLIMPLFLFIVGVSMPFSFAKRLQSGDSKFQIYSHIFYRTIVLFFLGSIVSWHLLEYDSSKIVWAISTLHTIAIGYFFASLLILNFNLLWQIAITVGLLLLFWILMTFGQSILTPDGNNAYCWGRSCMEKLGLIQFWDPNTGDMRLLSSITFTANVMLGVFAGELLHSKKSNISKVLWLLALGFGCFFAGLFWANSFPIIKRLWTSSFVVYSCGYSYLLLAVFYLIIDVAGLKKWAFGFVVIGVNAIAVYMATQLLDFRTIANIFIGKLAAQLGTWSDVLRASLAFVIVWLILLWMYRKKSFIKV